METLDASIDDLGRRANLSDREGTFSRESGDELEELGIYGVGLGAYKLVAMVDAVEEGGVEGCGLHTADAEFLGDYDGSRQELVDVWPACSRKDADPDTAAPRRWVSNEGVVLRVTYHTGVAGGPPPTMAMPIF